LQDLLSDWNYSPFSLLLGQWLAFPHRRDHLGLQKGRIRRLSRRGARAGLCGIRRMLAVIATKAPRILIETVLSVGPRNNQSGKQRRNRQDLIAHWQDISPTSAHLYLA
jgi:hypothetical protein